MHIIRLCLLIFSPITVLYTQQAVLVGAGKSIKGSREYQQDYFYLSPTTSNSVVAILCDGHGDFGHIIAKKVTNYLKIILNESYFTNNIDQNKKTIENAFQKVNTELKKDLQKSSSSGATCLAMLLIDNHFYIAHVGDSRAVWGCKPEDQTQDHTGQNSSEVKRVGKQNIKGAEKRLNGTLMITRAFGDFALEQYNLIAIPDITVLNSTTTPFVILGCDGLFDGTSKKKSRTSTQTDDNQLIYSIMYETIVNQKEPVELACKRILAAAICSNLKDQARPLINLFFIHPRTGEKGVFLRSIGYVPLDNKAVKILEPFKKEMILNLSLEKTNTFIAENEKYAHDNTTVICLYNKQHSKVQNEVFIHPPTNKKGNSGTFWEKLKKWWYNEKYAE